MPPLQASDLSRLLRRAARHQLFLVTISPAINGSVATLAGHGDLGDPLVLVALALTGIGGAGAFTLAAMEFGPSGDRRLLLLIAALSTVVVTAAAVLGVLVHAGDRHWLRIGGGLAALLVALQIGGVDVPSVRGVPASLVVVAAGVLAEVAA